MERYSDEELLYLVSCHCEEARKYLLDIYYPRVRYWVDPYVKLYPCMELEDFVQIGMITFWDAIKSFRDDLGKSLYSYVRVSVIRKIYIVISNLPENKFLKDFTCISLNQTTLKNQEGYLYEDVIGDESIIYQPHKIFEVRETTTQYLTQFENDATQIEKLVMYYLLEGYNEKEISKILQIPIKSVYNAAYRGHKKSLALT